MIAPLWCGFVSNGESPEGFKWSFLSAAVGMLIGGLVFYFFKDRYLHSPEGKPLGVKPEKKPEKKQGEANKRPAWFRRRWLCCVWLCSRRSMLAEATLSARRYIQCRSPFR